MNTILSGGCTALWIVLMILFLLVEAASPALLSIWFAAGALGAAVTAMLRGPVWLQVLIFLIISAVLLAMLRPFVRKFVDPRITRTNVDAVIGTVGAVTEPVDNLAASGRVKLGGMTWAARSRSGRPIPEGTAVRVEFVEGVKVIVSPVNEDSPA